MAGGYAAFTQGSSSNQQSSTGAFEQIPLEGLAPNRGLNVTAQYGAASRQQQASDISGSTSDAPSLNFAHTAIASNMASAYDSAGGSGGLQISAGVQQN